MNTRFALVDANNFYASCERVFNPRLIGRPVLVLSNNDGCVIARSEEAKLLGIEMGAPAFKNEEIFRRHGVHVLSSNYALYGDMSARVMATLRPVAKSMEVYSIDEAFLGLEPWQGESFCREMRAKVRQWTGIPVSVGIASTKTLSKLANQIAKKTPSLQGVTANTEPTPSATDRWALSRNGACAKRESHGDSPRAGRNCWWRERDGIGSLGAQRQLDSARWHSRLPWMITLFSANAAATNTGKFQQNRSPCI